MSKNTHRVEDFREIGDACDHAAFQRAIDALSDAGSYVGGEVLAEGEYYLTKTLAISKRITLRGRHAGDQPDTAASKLVFAPGVTGLRFHSGIDSPDGSGSDYSRVTGLNIVADGRAGDACGIHATAVIKIDRCIVRNFGGDGIYINGQTGEGATGIADGWSVSHTRIADNGGHGLHVVGNDSQVGHASQVECAHNAGFGFHDTAPYGSLYTACQASGNAGGSYYMRTATTYYGSILVGCYVEFGETQTACLDASAIVIGGTLAAVAGNAASLAYRYPGGYGPNVPAGERHMWFRDNTEIARIDIDDVLSGLRGLKFGSPSNYTLMHDNLVTQVTSTNGQQDRFRFDTPAGRAGSISTTSNTTSYNTSSDYRLKANAVPLTGALDAVMAMRPVTYDWRAGGHGVGFLAHELQAVAPYAVTGEKDGLAMQAVDLSKLVPLLVAAVQELAKGSRSRRPTSDRGRVGSRGSPTP